MTITASPLTWPNGWPRTPAADRKRAHFGRMKTSQSQYGGGWRQKKELTIEDASSFALGQLRMMGVGEDVILSTNLKLRLDGLPYSVQQAPSDPGAAVWWRPPEAKQERVIAIDIYNRVADNIYAIGKTLEAMRGIERWGGGEILERTFTGFAALPSPELAGGVDPYTVIGATRVLGPFELQQCYRRALSAAHPDRGGDSERFHQVRLAGRALGLV